MSLTADVLDIKSRILQYNADIKASLEGLGLTVPEGTQTKDFSTLIGQVSTSGDPIPLPMVFEIPTREDNLAMHFALETFEASDYSGTAVESYNTATSQTNILATDGTEWLTFPAGGVGSPYYTKGLAVMLQTSSETVTKFFVRYKFYIVGEDPTAEPWRFTICDIVGNNTINILSGTSAVVSATPPASPTEGMIWVEPIVASGPAEEPIVPAGPAIIELVGADAFAMIALKANIGATVNIDLDNGTILNHVGTGDLLMIDFEEHYGHGNITATISITGDLDGITYLDAGSAGIPSMDVASLTGLTWIRPGADMWTIPTQAVADQIVANGITNGTFATDAPFDTNGLVGLGWSVVGYNV